MEIEDKVAYALEEMAKDIRRMENEELQETLFFIQKLRLDIEQGRYDTEDKKWSELDWRM